MIEVSLKGSKSRSLNEFLLKKGFKVFKETGPTKNYPDTNYIHHVIYNGNLYPRPTGTNEQILEKLNKIIKDNE